jgi:hypothetical protein
MADERGLPDPPVVELPIYADQSRHLMIWILVFGGLFVFILWGAVTFHDPFFLLIGVGAGIGLVRTIRIYRGRFAVGPGWVAMRSGFTKWSVVGLSDLASVVEHPLQRHLHFGDRLTTRMVGGDRPVIVFKSNQGNEAAIDPDLLEGEAYETLVQQLGSEQRSIMEPQIGAFLLPGWDCPRSPDMGGAARHDYRPSVRCEVL